jgi:hypothetical protein
LFIPATVQLIHVIEGHEHQVCVSLEEQHFHENEFDCSQFHRPFQVLTVDFPVNVDDVPQQYYVETPNCHLQEKSIQLVSKKNPRGPPYFIV